MMAHSPAFASHCHWAPPLLLHPPPLTGDRCALPLRLYRRLRPLRELARIHDNCRHDLCPQHDDPFTDLAAHARQHAAQVRVYIWGPLLLPTYFSSYCSRLHDLSQPSSNFHLLTHKSYAHAPTTCNLTSSAHEAFASVLVDEGSHTKSSVSSSGGGQALALSEVELR